MEQEGTNKTGSAQLYKYTQVVGIIPTTTITIDGIEAHSLFDTGSQVTTATYQFFKDHLEPQGVTLEEGKWFELSGANGLEIPYIGMVFVDIVVEGNTVPQRGVLIMKDTPDITRSRQDVPVILGMNVIGSLSQAQGLLGQTCSSKTSGVQTQEINGSNHREFVRVAMESFVPANVVGGVPVRMCKIQGPLLVEPLPGNVMVSQMLIDSRMSVSRETAGINAGETPLFNTGVPEEVDLVLGFSGEEMEAEVGHVIGGNQDDASITENRKVKTEFLWCCVNAMEHSAMSHSSLYLVMGGDVHLSIDFVLAWNRPKCELLSTVMTINHGLSHT